MTHPLNLKLIVGSTRDGRAADRVLPWLTRRLEVREDFATEVLDLRQWALPIFAETFATVGDPRDPTFSTPVVRSWNDVIGGADAFLFLTPEYNHSVPAVLKNAVDSVFATFGFRNKPFACVAYSGSIAGGSRAVEHMAHIGIEAEMTPLRNNVLLPYVGEAIDERGEPKDPRTDLALSILLDDLAWWGAALKEARRGPVLPPAFFRQMAAQSATEHS